MGLMIEKNMGRVEQYEASLSSVDVGRGGVRGQGGGRRGGQKGGEGRGG